MQYANLEVHSMTVCEGQAVQVLEHYDRATEYPLYLLGSAALAGTRAGG